MMDYQNFRTNGSVTVHDVPEPELFNPVFPIAAAAERAIRTGEAGGWSALSEMSRSAPEP